MVLTGDFVTQLKIVENSGGQHNLSEVKTTREIEITVICFDNQCPI